jgi:nucleotide-binding universal stress UspA family protein
MKATKAAIYRPESEAASLPLVRRILHPTDLTDSSVRALTFAIRLARQNHAELLLAHALPPPTPIFEIESPELHSAEADMEALVDKLSSQGICARRIIIKGTHPIPGNIVECARFFGADLIVMGTGSRRGLARFLRGSIAASVVKKAPCPVLVVRSIFGDVASTGEVT